MSLSSGHPSLQGWVPEGLPKIFLRAQPCDPFLFENWGLDIREKDKQTSLSQSHDH